MPRARIAVVLLAVLLAAPAGAHAKELFVSGIGTGSAGCLSPADPCTLEQALATAVNGDVVIVSGAAGPITVADTVGSSQAISIRSTDPAAPKPVVSGAPSADGAPLIDLNGPGASISGLDLRNTAPGPGAGAAVMLRGQGTILQDSVVSSAGTALASQQSAALVRRVIARGGAVGASLAAEPGEPATVVNSVITADGAGGVGLVNDSSGEVRAVNVTVLATGADGVALRAPASAVGGVDGARLTVRNAIARGTKADLSAGVPAACAPAPCGAGALVVDHSSFLVAEGPVTQGAGNVGFPDPGFVSAGDLRLRADSPLRDLGVSDPLSEPVDLDGSPRTDGPAPDLGAYEYLIPLPPKNPLPPESAPVVPADTTAPTLGVVRLSNARFRVGARATALSAAARRRVPVGTVVTTGVTERSTVLFEIERIVTGRRSAGRCVKATARALKRLKARQRCRLALAIEPGLERVADRPGRVSFAFSGRIGSRALPAGSYAMVVTATDAAGNRSAAQRATFTIAARERSKRRR